MKTLFFAAGISIFILLNSCHKPSATPNLRTAMGTYDRLIRKTNADSIAMLYTVDGDLGVAAHGRDSIRNFLKKFRDYKVLEQLSTIDSMSIKEDTGFVHGTFHQTTIIPVHDSLNMGHIRDTITVRGVFHSEWLNIPEYGWQIRRMETGPVNN
jgi:hypothetical protein